jgi:hypothetical protein
MGSARAGGIGNAIHPSHFEYLDDDIEVLLNGVRAYFAKGYMNRYENQPLRKKAQGAIKPGEDIVIAVHCHQNAGGQYIDVGLTERVPAKK